MAGGFRIDIAIVDVDQEMVPGQDAAHALDIGDNVGPGYKTDVRQAVEARRETKSTQEEGVKMSTRHPGGEHIVNADKRLDLGLAHRLTHAFSRGSGGS